MQEIIDYLEKLLLYMGLNEEEFEVSVEEDDEQVMVQINVPEEQTGLFIGARAEVINSIQRILRIIFEESAEKKIVLNINQYRQEQQEQRKDKIREAIDQLEDADQEYVFPYVSSFERFQIHSLVSEDEEFTAFESFSEGEGRDRRLIIRRKAE
jgi:spoIIIJ-associated protein